MSVTLSMPALRLLVAANPIAAAPRVREMLATIPPEKRRAALEKLVTKAGLDPQQAFDLQGRLAPELTVELLGGPGVRKCIRRACQAMEDSKHAVFSSGLYSPQSMAWDWGYSWRDLVVVRSVDRECCLRHRMILQVQKSARDLRTGEPSGITITEYRLSPLFATC